MRYEWTPETIHSILRSRIYKGDMVQGIYDCEKFKRTPSKRKPSDEWYITTNTHDPIVNDELWHYVQNCMNTRKRVQRNGEPHKDADRLASLLAAQNGDTEEQRIQSLTAALKAAEARSAELDGIIEQLYEDKVGGGITEARFRKLSAKYEAEQNAKEKAASEIKAEIERTIANKKDASAWLELIRNYTDIQELDRVVLGELIEKITVGESQVIDCEKHVDITIYYRFVGAVNTANLTAR